MQDQGLNPWLYSLAGLLIPGAGHLFQRKWVRGLVLGGAVFLMFFLGVWMGGNVFSISSTEEGINYLLQFPPAFANLGNGLLYLGSLIFGVGASPDLPKLATYEYGQRFILVAGLLNYLIALDCFDIAVKRKQ